jgi:hypothetical protein
MYWRVYFDGSAHSVKASFPRPLDGYKPWHSAELTVSVEDSSDRLMQHQ